MKRFKNFNLLVFMAILVIVSGCGSKNNRVNDSTFDDRFIGRENTSLDLINEIRSSLSCNNTITKREVVINSSGTSGLQSNTINIYGAVVPQAQFPNLPITKQFAGVASSGTNSNYLDELIVVTEFSNGNGQTQFLVQFEFCGFPYPNDLTQVSGTIFLDTDTNYTLGAVNGTNLSFPINGTFNGTSYTPSFSTPTQLMN